MCKEVLCEFHVCVMCVCVLACMRTVARYPATPYLLLIPSVSSLHSCSPVAARVSNLQSILMPTSTNTHQEALTVILSIRLSDLPQATQQARKRTGTMCFPSLMWKSVTAAVREGRNNRATKRCQHLGYTTFILSFHCHSSSLTSQQKELVCS